MTKNKRLEAAQVANEKRKNGENLLASNLKSLIMYVLPISGSVDPPSRYSTRPAIEERLGTLEKSWWEYIPEVIIEDTQEDEVAVVELAVEVNADGKFLMETI